MAEKAMMEPEQARSTSIPPSIVHSTFKLLIEDLSTELFTVTTRRDGSNGSCHEKNDQQEIGKKKSQRFSGEIL